MSEAKFVIPAEVPVTPSNTTGKPNMDALEKQRLLLVIQNFQQQLKVLLRAFKEISHSAGRVGSDVVALHSDVLAIAENYEGGKELFDQYMHDSNLEDFRNRMNEFFKAIDNIRTFTAAHDTTEATTTDETLLIRHNVDIRISEKVIPKISTLEFN